MKRDYSESEIQSWKAHPENVVNSILRDELGPPSNYPVTLAARIVNALKREGWLPPTKRRQK